MQYVTDNHATAQLRLGRFVDDYGCLFDRGIRAAVVTGGQDVVGRMHRFERFYGLRNCHKPNG